MEVSWLPSLQDPAPNNDAFAKKDADKHYIDYKIKNLPSFLQEINVLKTA